MGWRKGSGSWGTDRRDGQASPRIVGKGRYTNAPPLTPGNSAGRGPEMQVHEGDVTIVLEDDAHRVRVDKYGSRSAGAYGAVPRPDAGDPAPAPPERPVSDEAGAGTGAVFDLMRDDAIPAWGPWRSEVVSSFAGYRRFESRLPLG